ncbi:MAG TPA: YeeE/YedE thiosulfate transporter family protein [Polyangiaceae bacterium]
MPETSFTPVSALAGGVLIGLGASVYLLVNGRVAGVSGLLSGLFASARNRSGLGEVFLAAVLATGVLAGWLLPEAFGASHASFGTLGLAGLLVGVGTRVSGGCTSGHGLCGISRGSLRSIVATTTFVLAGVLTVTLVRSAGGSP